MQHKIKQLLIPGSKKNIMFLTRPLAKGLNVPPMQTHAHQYETIRAIAHGDGVYKARREVEVKVECWVTHRTFDVLERLCGRTVLDVAQTVPGARG